KSAPWTGSYAEDRFNSFNSFVFADSSGMEKTVRWSLLPAAQPVPVSPEDLAKRGPDFLEQEIIERVRGAPQHWTMVVSVAATGPRGGVAPTGATTPPIRARLGRKTVAPSTSARSRCSR